MRVCGVIANTKGSEQWPVGCHVEVGMHELLDAHERLGIRRAEKEVGRDVQIAERVGETPHRSKPQNPACAEGAAVEHRLIAVSNVANGCQ